MTHEGVSSVGETAYSGEGGWLGVWDSNSAGVWVDSALLLVKHVYTLRDFTLVKILSWLRKTAGNCHCIVGLTAVFY